MSVTIYKKMTPPVSIVGPLTDAELTAHLPLAITGPLTDAQLAARLPLSVAGPLTDAQLAARLPLSVIGPLTDAQLRAALVGVTEENTAEMLGLLQEVEGYIATAIYGEAAQGNIVILNSAAVTPCDAYQEGDNFTLDDGVHAAVTFEFCTAETEALVGAGNVAVIMGADPATALANAISAAPNLDISAVKVSGFDVIELTAIYGGAAGNVLMTYAEAISGTYSVSGMSGGIDAVGTRALPQVLTVTLTNNNTEYSVRVPANNGFELRARTAVNVRYAFETDKVATPVEPYATLVSNTTVSNKTENDPFMLYLACATPGTVVEIVVYAV